MLEPTQSLPPGMEELPRHRRRWSFLTPLWHRHPGVRQDAELTLGERAADRMRNGMGSWAFVFAALGFLAVWMMFNRNVGFDKYPFILLNLVLSCLAAMQGAILLIAAKRSDQIASELAQHDYETDQTAAARVEQVHARLLAVESQAGTTSEANHELLQRVLAELGEIRTRLASGG